MWADKIRRDEQFMALALREAERAGKLGEIPVGACLVRGDEVLAVGHNLRETAGTALGHAEIAVIDAACRRLGSWRLADCEIYVTLEPCPMCAGAIINARIARVVYGAADSKTGALGSVCNLAAMDLGHRPAITPGCMAAQSAELLADFFAKLRSGDIK